MDTLIACRLRPSPALARLYAVTHLAALAGALEPPVPWPIRAAAAAGVIAHLGWTVWHVAWRHTQWAPVRLGWSQDDVFVVQRRDGAHVVAQLVGPAFVHPWLVAMRLEPVGGRRWARFSVVVPFDSCSAEEHRSLRVTLRYLARTGVA